MCERGGETERNFIVHFRECFGRPVTVSRSRCGLEISGATNNDARGETSGDGNFYSIISQEAITIVNVSPRDGIRRQI